MRKVTGPIKAVLAGLLLTAAASAATASTWPMKQRDVHHTGRAAYVVPQERMNSSFFDAFLWQKPSPGFPDYGFSNSSMSFFDGAGPGGADIVLVGYHWPKGVQAMDRHTGRLFWTGNPDGGETIGGITPAFSNDGATVYIVNDATESGQYPNGHPLMAFSTVDGPTSYRHNGNNANPHHLEMSGPVIAPDGRIFLHQWAERPYAGSDDGAEIHEVWAAATPVECAHSDVSLYQDGDTLRVLASASSGGVKCYDGTSGGELWNVDLPGLTVQATPTVDPLNGNVYVPAGDASIYIVGLNKDGQALWGDSSVLVYEHGEGQNDTERAQTGGCLSQDSATFYFQTVSRDGDGKLYAINTASGTVKWSYETGSRIGEVDFDWASSPVVTTNGVVIVGNNAGDAYLAILDSGIQGTLLDSFEVTPGGWGGGHAYASPTLSPDGVLYLPLHTAWLMSNGDGDQPTDQVGNLFTAFDLRPDAQAQLPPPPWQAGFARNDAILLRWQPVTDQNGVFDHYAIYRNTQPFTSVVGMKPIATVGNRLTVQYLDPSAMNGTAYYFAVTSVTQAGVELPTVRSVGPRTPLDETDLQVLSISRTPRYPRYDPIYTYYEITEPGGYGPYTTSAATALGGGQNQSTQRWPAIGSSVSYTATVRNRGTNPWNGSLYGAWRWDGEIVEQVSAAVTLEPGESTTYVLVRAWDGAAHTVSFTIEPNDARSANDILSIDTKAVDFLTYIDASCLEQFREETKQYPGAVTDDFVDWLNRHMGRFNQMFSAVNSHKRVHYGVLEVLDDWAPDPDIERIDFAIFPFRYRSGQASVRSSGWYNPTEDIDFGLLHEMGHQLGLIDLYRLNISSEQNQVSHQGYSAPGCLMNACDSFLSEHSARGMEHWLDQVHGYFGQYMYCMPQYVKMRFFGLGHQPLVGATVKIYQMAERPGLGQVILDQIKAQGVTDGSGEWILPNIEIDPAMFPPTYAGDVLHNNPFGYLSPGGTNGVLLLRVEQDGFTDYAWLDVTEVNNAYWIGQTSTATFERNVLLGGTIQTFPPADMTERNASSWASWADNAWITAIDDLDRHQVGDGSIRFETNGGFDTYVRYPGDQLARWDLSQILGLRIWCYAENPHGFQSASPWIQLEGPNGFVEYRPTWDILNTAIGRWVEFTIPVKGDETWIRTDYGNVSLSEINGIKIHADTWGFGFTLWIDGLGFSWGPAGVKAENADPLRLALAPPVPNPALDASEVRYELPAAREVSLEVSDVTGRMVRGLVHAVQPAGRYAVRWDGRNAAGRKEPGGVYFIRIMTGGQVLDRKLVLLR